MDKRIVINYAIGDNLFIFIIDENDELLSKIDTEKIKETFTSEYETHEERFYTGVSALINEIYKYGDFETTENIDSIINTETSDGLHNNNIMVYSIIVLIAFLLVFLLIKKKRKLSL